MGDDDKPFACTEPDCGMRFTNEDHLTVHKMKHEMSLALTAGAKAGSFLTFADQTPTPTKFLKNCEEIGLFNDLTKNPFEEAFKKAAETLPEGVKGHDTLVPHGPGNEGLHTPQPHVALPQSSGTTPVHEGDTESGRTSPEGSRDIPLPGPDSIMGSTVGASPAGSGISNKPRSPVSAPLLGRPGGGGGHNNGGSSSTASTPTSSSTSGLPFKLKLKREPLLESDLSIISGLPGPGSTVNASPRTLPGVGVGLAAAAAAAAAGAGIGEVTGAGTRAGAGVRTEVKGYKRDSMGAILHGGVPPSTSSLMTSPTKIAMVSPTPLSHGVRTFQHTAGGGPPTLTTQQNAANASGKAPQYFLQVMVQMPSGEMLPVQIPAAPVASSAPAVATTTVSSVAAQAPLPTQTQVVYMSEATTQPSAAARTTTPNVTLVTSNATAPTTTMTNTASFSTKQKLKAALQQNVQQNMLNSHMRLITEAVDRVTGGSGSSSPLSSAAPSPLMVNTSLSPGPPGLPSGSRGLSQTLLKLPLSGSTPPHSASMASLASYDGSNSPTAYAMMGKTEDEDDDDRDPDDRRKKFLERNRAAAARCRQKKKVWINCLEKKADDLQNSNSKLQNEVTFLRGEVAQLKTLLLAHKDCPITVQMQNSGLIKSVTQIETQSDNISSTSSAPGVAMEAAQMDGLTITKVTMTSTNSTVTTQALASFPIVIDIKPEK